MKTRVAIVAALITVLLSACNNKQWVECAPSTTLRTKNKALNWKEPPTTTIYYGEARGC